MYLKLNKIGYAYFKRKKIENINSDQMTLTQTFQLVYFIHVDSIPLNFPHIF